MLPRKITTDRLILSPPTVADTPVIVELANDPVIAEMTLSIPYPYSEADAVTWLHMANRGREAENVFIYALRTIGEGEFMGGVGLHMDDKYGFGELGYWIGAPYRGRGFVTEAVGGLVEAGFTHTGLYRIQAIHHENNPASGKVLFKNGLKEEARLEDYVVKDGKPTTVRQYRILRREWEAKRSR